MVTTIPACYPKSISIFLCKRATLEAYQAFKLYIVILSTANLGIYLRTSCQFTPRLQLYYTVNVPYFSFIISCLSSFVKNFFQLFLKYFFLKSFLTSQHIHYIITTFLCQELFQLFLKFFLFLKKLL